MKDRGSSNMTKIMMMGSTRIEESPKKENELRLRGVKNIIETSDDFSKKVAWRSAPQSVAREEKKSYRKTRYN